MGRQEYAQVLSKLLSCRTHGLMSITIAGGCEYAGCEKWLFWEECEGWESLRHSTLAFLIHELVESITHSAAVTL